MKIGALWRGRREVLLARVSRRRSEESSGRFIELHCSEGEADGLRVSDLLYPYPSPAAARPLLLVEGGLGRQAGRQAGRRLQKLISPMQINLIDSAGYYCDAE